MELWLHDIVIILASSMATVLLFCYVFLLRDLLLDLEQPVDRVLDGGLERND